MAVKRYYPDAQAYGETLSVPKRYDASSGAYVETTGKAYDPDAAAWEEKWSINKEPTEGLVAKYFVDKSDGTDESGNDTPLTLVNCTVQSGSVTGKDYFRITNAVAGTELYTAYPYTALNVFRHRAPTALSASVWVRAEEIASCDDDNIITVPRIYLFCFSEQSRNSFTWNGVRTFEISVESDRLTVRASGSTKTGNVITGGESYETVRQKTAINSSTWTHYVVICTQDTGYIYENGKLVAYGYINNDALFYYPSEFCNNNYGFLTFGHRVWYTSAYGNAAGTQLSNIRFYDRELTQQEVLTLYNDGKGM